MVYEICKSAQSTFKIKDRPGEKTSFSVKVVSQSIDLFKKKDTSPDKFSLQKILKIGFSIENALILHRSLSNLLWDFKSRDLRSVFCQKDDFLKKISMFEINSEDLSLAVVFVDEIVKEYKSAITTESLDQSLNPFIIHFSQKLTHTKTFGGVFIPASRKSNLPYLFSGSIQQTINQNIPADIAIKNNVSTSISIINGKNKEDAENPIHKNLIDWYESKLKNEVNCDFVDSRLTQLILPKDDGLYVAVTPLSAGGILSIMNDRSYGELTGEDGKTVIKSIFQGSKLKLPIGGANPVNVSLHTSNIQNAWLHRTPEQSDQIRRALSVFYRGFRIFLDKKLLTEYALWLNNSKDFVNDRDTVKARDLELKTSVLYKLISKVAKDLNSSIDDFDGSRLQIVEKINSGDRSNFGLIEKCIFEGEFNEAGITALTNKIIQRLSMNSDGIAIVYSEQTRSRHKTSIADILKEKISFRNGV
jgi:hypothetical protein